MINFAWAKIKKYTYIYGLIIIPNIMIFLQVPSTDEIAKDVSSAFDGLHSGWTQFWKLFLDSPFEALKFLGHVAAAFAVKVLIAVIVFYVGRWLIRRLRRTFMRIADKRHVDSSVQIFIDNLVAITLSIALLILVIYILGVSMTGLIAIFAAAAFAIGMALSGTMSNFAGGVLILLQKPYRIGDYIEAQGYGGTVKNIKLFSTVITTPDNKTVIIPNGPLSTGSVNNFSRQNTRRVDWAVSISYGDDFDKARQLIRSILAADPRVMNKPDYTIAISSLTLNSVDLTIRCWVRSTDFWSVYFDINRELYMQLPANGIKFPSTQMEVRLTQADAASSTPTAKTDDATKKK